MQNLDLLRVLKNAQNKKETLAVIIFTNAINILAFVLGLGYVFVALGVQGFVKLTIACFQPARKKFYSFLGVAEDIESLTVTMTLRTIMSIILRSIVYIALIAIGIEIIRQITFCQQNLICLLMKKL